MAKGRDRTEQRRLLKRHNFISMSAVWTRSIYICCQCSLPDPPFFKCFPLQVSILWSVCLPRDCLNGTVTSSVSRCCQSAAGPATCTRGIRTIQVDGGPCQRQHSPPCFGIGLACRDVCRSNLAKLQRPAAFLSRKIGAASYRQIHLLPSHQHVADPRCDRLAAPTVGFLESGLPILPLIVITLC